MIKINTPKSSTMGNYYQKFYIRWVGYPVRDTKVYKIKIEPFKATLIYLQREDIDWSKPEKSNFHIEIEQLLVSNISLCRKKFELITEIEDPYFKQKHENEQEIRLLCVVCAVLNCVVCGLLGIVI